MNKLVFKVNEKACVAFLDKYPLVANLIANSQGKDLLSAYRKFLKFKDQHEPKLGGRAETISSKTFGTKTFYHYEWGACSGWAEVFQFCKLGK
jgi:hypothetical protein